MFFTKELKDNLHLLLVEVTKQYDDTISMLQRPNIFMKETMYKREDYIDNMKNVIKNKSYNALLDSKDMPRRELNLMKAVNVITNNLENIADFCLNIVEQIDHFSHINFFQKYNYIKFSEQITPCIGLIEESLYKPDIDLALRICRSEFKIDEMYKEDLDRLILELESGTNVKDLITCLFIFRYFERIGDRLLNIGEQIISSTIGEKIKIHQYTALEEGFDALESENGEDENDSIENGHHNLSFKHIADTKSGCKVGLVREKSNIHETRWVIFKEGQAHKVAKEKENIEKWDKLCPGLPPRIYGYNEHGKNASLLLEYLEGITFQEVVLTSPIESILKALNKVETNLEHIWNKTKKENSVKANFMYQVEKRINDIYRLHPEFEIPEHSIGSLKVESIENLILKMKETEEHLSAPFSVMIHGDLNIDNLLYNNKANKISFIDLNRSTDLDYTQDISVFLLSNFRLPVFEKEARNKINTVLLEFYYFSCKFAKKNNDKTFEIRLALGLIRSFMTSTRFVADKNFSKTMFFRAKYLMEYVLAKKSENWENFRIPTDILIH